MTRLALSDRLIGWAAWALVRPMIAALGISRANRLMFEGAGIWGLAGMPGFRTTRADLAGLPALWITPPGIADTAPVIVHIHGGGFVLGSPRTHRRMVAWLAQAAGMRAVLPSYPLAPEAPFPAAVEHLKRVWDALPKDSPIALSGDSAGGCLVLGLAQFLRDTGRTPPHALYLVSPVADLTGSSPSMTHNLRSELLLPERWALAARDAYLAGHGPEDPVASPLLGDLTGLPPTLIQIAKGEALEDEGRRIADGMGDKARLSIFPQGHHHVWQLHAGLTPGARKALREGAAFLRERCG